MTKSALLVGVSEYESGLSPLPQALKDVEAMQQVLLHPDMGNLAHSQLVVLKNPERQKLEEAMEKLFVTRQPNDLVLFFFSGHGLKDETGKLYLATRNTKKTAQGDLIRSSAMAASFVHESMNRSRSQLQVVILDSCFSGAFGEGLLAKDDGRINIGRELGAQGRAILTSSSSTQYSFEQKGEELSLYTRYLIEGIKTGQADFNRDGIVSVGELHQYASEKVQQIKPMIKPEIYLDKEGYTIPLAKVPPGDAKEKYRQEVLKYCSRGEISFVDRKILDALRVSLVLSKSEASAIEEEIIASSSEEFKDKLQRYEQDLTEAFKQGEALSEAELDKLRKNLQQIWGLREEDTQLIEARVKSQVEAHRQRLFEYGRALAVAMRQENPLSEGTLRRLGQMQQQWELTPEEIALVESRIHVELKIYRQKLRQYEQLLFKAIQQQYPLNSTQRHSLRQKQQTLGLKDEDLTPIETRIIAQFKAYQQKLQQYEQLLSEAIEHEFPLSEEVRQKLRQFQQVLKLKNKDVSQIEQKVLRQKQINQLPDAPENSRPRIETEQESTAIKRRQSLKWIVLTTTSAFLTILGSQKFRNSRDNLQDFSQEVEEIRREKQTPKEKERQEVQESRGEKETPKEQEKSLLALKTFQFESVTINQRAQKINSSVEQAQYFSEDLGNGVILEMVAIKGGTLTMGSPKQEKYSNSHERPQHSVTVQPFLMGKFQVTQAQWRAIASLAQIQLSLDPNPSYFQGYNRPVERVSWYDALEFCARLSHKTGREYRLPSEAQWEYAARAGTRTPFHFGETVTTYLANYNGNYLYASESRGKFRKQTTSVGSFSPNAFGLYDIHGNVWEWCTDHWHDNYQGAPTDASSWLYRSPNPWRVIRGGSWHSAPLSCRSSSRDKAMPNLKYETLSLRVVLVT